MAADSLFVEDSDQSNSSSAIAVPQPGIGLCLSGGGYRAALFHLGTLWRLNEFGYLKRIDRISSVSGGQIVSARLGLVWDKLAFDEAGVAQNFAAEVVAPIRNFTTQKLDAYIIALGLLNPFSSIGEMLTGEHGSISTATQPFRIFPISRISCLMPPMPSRARSGASRRRICATGRWEK